MTTQEILKAKAQEQNNRFYDDCFIDASKCEICGSHDIKYTQKLNGVISECLGCKTWEDSHK